MRHYLDLNDGTVSTEFPVKGGECRQTVKALAGERVQLRWLNAGVAYELPAGTSVKYVVRSAKGGTLLAELTSFTAPDDVTTGFYTGRLSFNTDTVVDLLAANPTKTTFTAVGEILWKIAGATDWECSDDIILVLLKKVSAGDDEGDPLVLASGFQWLQDHLVAGSNVTLTVDEGAETISIAALGGYYLDSISGNFFIVKNSAGTTVGKVQRFAV